MMKACRCLIRWVAVSLPVLGILSGCVGTPQIKQVSSVHPQNTVQTTSLTPRSTAISSQDGTATPPATDPATPLSGVAPSLGVTLQVVPSSGNGKAPLRFNLPTPGPAPKSLWRPPLYDTPWALGPFDHFYFSRPIAADEVNWPEWDYRYGGVFFGSNIVHTGIDIAASLHTPVIAAGDGRVVWAGYGLYYGSNQPNDPYGLAVTIRHNFGYQGKWVYTVYAHMDRIDVVTGQDVKTGDPLGIVGLTGNTTGPHLHFEVRMEKNSYFSTLNPELWLAPPQGWGVLVGRLLNTNGSLLTQQMVSVTNIATRQTWKVRSYGNQAVNSDSYYQENLVLSDLPAGKYRVDINYLDEDLHQEIEIHAGAIAYFSFQGEKGFKLTLPPVPDTSSITGSN